MLYYENTMINTKNIILIASITAVLGFGIVALQTNTVAVDALMDNTSEILDLGEKSEITTLAAPEGKGKKVSLEGQGMSVDGETTIKCSASRTFSCNVKNSVDGLTKVSLSAVDGDVGANCNSKEVKPGATRASVNNRKSDPACDYTPTVEYTLEVGLNVNPCCGSVIFLITTDTVAGKLVITDITPPATS